MNGIKDIKSPMRPLVAGAVLSLLPAMAGHAHHPPGGLGVQVVGRVL